MKRIVFFLPFVLISFLASTVSSQNPKTEGYKGIWFTLGQFSEYGDKYSGGLGTYTADLFMEVQPGPMKQGHHNNNGAEAERNRAYYFFLPAKDQPDARGCQQS